MKNLRFLMAFAAALTFSVTAFAQDAAPEGDDVTAYDFEDDLISGDIARPDGEILNARTGNGANMLIRPRQHFIPEMLKSVEDL